MVISDLTRPCPSERLLPPVMAELATAGVCDDNVRVVIALGLHRFMTEAEMRTAVGLDVYRRAEVTNHDPTDCVRLGVTFAGTPVEIFVPVAEGDLRICLADLELHYFAGYSGGAKSLFPGCASRAAVTVNHAMMVRPEAAAEHLPSNPVRADIEEGAAMVGVDFIVNVAMYAWRPRAQHRITRAVAGDVTAAHRRGCQMVAERATIPIESPSDLIVVSAGGYPRDVNLYQAQKALDHAAHAVRDSGIIILVAKCPEGLGDRTFAIWMTGADGPEASYPGGLLDRIEQGFALGGHKAAAIAAVLQHAEVYLVPTLPDELVLRCALVPYAELDAALNAALGRLGPAARVLVLPQGGSVLPAVSP